MLKIKNNKNKYTNMKATLEESFWPCAVHPNMICKKGEKSDFARGIVEHMIDEKMSGKRILNFGFEDYPVSKIISKEYNPEISVGFSFFRLGKKNKKNLLLTNDIEDVQENGPYDIILIYDVIDHIQEDPVDILKEAKDLLKKNGTIYVRFHPFCSRNALHLHHDLNKAYIHLLFTGKELDMIVPNNKKKYNRGIINPSLYDDYKKTSGLKVKYKREVLEVRNWPFYTSKEKVLNPRVELNEIFKENKRKISQINEVKNWKRFIGLIDRNIEYIDYALVK